MDFPFRNIIKTNEFTIEKLDFDNSNINSKLKPNGLWYGFRDSWYSWSNEKFKKKKEIKYLYKIIIKNNQITTIDNLNKNKILSLQSKSDLEKFIKRYGYIVKDIFPIQKISWERVIKEFGGFEINNKLRTIFTDIKITPNDTIPFYYVFDVPSGVIWNKNIVCKIEFVKKIK